MAKLENLCDSYKGYPTRTEIGVVTLVLLKTARELILDALKRTSHFLMNDAQFILLAYKFAKL